MMAGGRLNILMTADAVGGVWQYATGLSAELTAGGHRVTVAVLGPAPSAAARERANAIDGVRLVETGLPLDWLSSGPEPVSRAAEAIAALAAEERADLVHCNSPALAGAARFPAPVIAVSHGCVATWWQAARTEPLAPDFHWHRQMTRKGLLTAETVVAPSASHAGIVQRVYELPECPLVVHNGRPEAARSTTEGVTLRSALTVGRLWDDVKGARLLDDVAAGLGIPFLAAGALRGPHGEEFMPRHLRALGHLDGKELPALLDLRPVFVSAATFEPFGLAVLEAAAAGCALVLADIPTFRELWEGAAIFVPPTDAAGFAEAIGSVVDDPSRRRALGQAAAQRASRFTPGATARAMTAIYRRVLEPQEAAA
jgi:glycosyltransferase involved in cell wall biosynthesis